jgi:Family of unknown function (DUF5329)
MQRSLVLVLILLAEATTFARDVHEQQRIDYLIDSLGSLKGAVFIRNGKEYDAPAARDHLRSKLNVAGDRVKTAEQFIKYCATQSSMSHQPYKIRFADGAEKETAVYFGDKLKEFDAKRR